MTFGILFHSFAQQDTLPKKKKFIPDSNRKENTLLYKPHAILQLSLSESPKVPDTSLLNFENYNPDYVINYDTYFFVQSVGMAGRWHRRYYFGVEDRFINPQNQWTLDLSGYYTWLILPDSLQLINTFTPYSRIQYQQGKRQLQITDALFSANITPQWNIHGGYHRLTWLGMYRNNNTDVRNAYFNSFYYALNKRFFAHYYLIFNELKQAENGGIFIDSTTTNLFEKDVQTVNTSGFSLIKNNFGGLQLGYQWLANSSHTLQTTLQYRLDFAFKLTNLNRMLPIYNAFTSKKERYVTEFGFWQQQYCAGMQYRFKKVFSQSIEWTRNYTKTPKGTLYKTYNELFPKYVTVDILKCVQQLQIGDSSRHIWLKNYFTKHLNAFLPYQQIQSTGTAQYTFLAFQYDLIHQRGYVWNKVVPLPEIDTNFIQLSVLQENANLFFVHPRVGVQSRRIGKINVGFFHTAFQTSVYQGLTLSAQVYYQKWNLIANLVHYSRNSLKNVPNTFQTKIFYATWIFKKKMYCHVGLNVYYTGKYRGHLYDIAYDYVFAKPSFYESGVYPTYTGLYVRVDPFFNFSIKRASFYFRFTNIAEGLLGKKGYFTTPFYQMEERALGLSFCWRFYD
ncbi:MAG: putative porin [Bacteroidia bacterium]|nr:putative porin [Bacteroidia bacterium]